jgi:hypothetical protein
MAFQILIATILSSSGSGLIEKRYDRRQPTAIGQQEHVQ